VQTLRFESTARLGKGVTTTLGTKDFDGVRAEGKSTVWTIPAGEIGNRNPIQVTSESWYAPDLQVTVYRATTTRARANRSTGLRASDAPSPRAISSSFPKATTEGRGKREERK
jgi:hypothetical protein